MEAGFAYRQVIIPLKFRGGIHAKGRIHRPRADGQIHRPQHPQSRIPARRPQPLASRRGRTGSRRRPACIFSRRSGRQVDVVFTNLPDQPDVEKVVLGENGISSGAHPGLIWVDNSTIKPAAARSLQRKTLRIGVLSLDAPVSGGDVGARDGTLAIMVGGPAEALDKVMPVLQAMGKTVTHVGDAGAGQVAKAANQIMVAAQMVAMGELLIFSQKAGVDPRKVVDAIKGGAAQCWTLDVKPPRLFSGDRNPGFKSRMMSKDLNIILETAREYGIPSPPLPWTPSSTLPCCKMTWVTWITLQ